MQSSDLPPHGGVTAQVPTVAALLPEEPEHLSHFEFSPLLSPYPSGSAEYEVDFEQRTIASASLAIVQRDLCRNSQDHAERSKLLKGITRLVRGVSDPDYSEQLGNAIVKQLIGRLAQGLENAELRNYYLCDKLSESDRLLALKYCSSQARVAFLESLMELSASNAAVARFVDSKLGNCLAFTSAQERAELARRLLLAQDNPFYISLSVRLIGAAPNLSELSACVEQVGPDLMLATSDAMLKDLVVRAKYGHALRTLTEQSELLDGKDAQRVSAAAQGLEQRLEKAIALMRQSEGDKPEGLAGRWLEIAHSNLELLRERLKSPKNWEEVADGVNVIGFKSWLEFRYGLRFTNESHSFFSPGASWGMESLTQAAAALERLPEGLIYRTPLLTEIQRVHSLGIGIMGQRFDDGIIRITDLAIDNPVVEATYEQASSLEAVLIHEIGHGVQIGSAQLSFVSDDQGRLDVAEGDPEYEFRDYARISGWELIDPARIQFTDNQYTVLLDDQEVPLGLPALFKGKFVMLIANQGMLFMYRCDGEFSVVPYARSNPWEDWAEAFTEYFMRPDRLIRRAPTKFRHFENQFHFYSERSELLAALQRQLSNY